MTDLKGQLPPPHFAMVAIGAVAIGAIASRVFHRADYQFAENI